MNIKKTIIVIVTACFLFSCSKERKEINNLQDAQTVTIGATIGTTSEKLAHSRFPKATIKSFDDVMDAVAALKSEQVDAVVTAYTNVVNICKHNPELKYVTEVIEYENACVAIAKGNDELLAQVNSLIKDLKADSTLKDMKRRWFKDDFLPYETVDFKLPATGIPLKIGVAANREPLCFKDEKQQVSGHDAELARRIAVKLGRPIQFVDMKFSALIMALQSGKIDMIVTGMSSTPERKKSVDFSESYFDNAQVLLVKKSKSEISQTNQKLKSLEDLKTKKIGVLLGSVHDKYALNNFPKATILQYKNPSDLVLAVKSEKVQAAFYTHETLLEILRKDNDLDFLAESIFKIQIGVGFNQNNDALRDQCNNFLKEIKSNGVYDDMKERWVNKGISTMPVIKNNETNGTLILGIMSDKGLPFTIIKDNKMVGFDIELAERFAAFLGKKLQFVDMEFGSLIAAVSTNKIDAIFSTLMITEDRKKQIDFSDPYMELGASVFALKKNLAKYDNIKTTTNSSENTFFKGISNSFYNNLIFEDRYLLIIDGLKTTAIISIFTTIFGTLLGGLICFMRMSRNRIIQSSAKVYISVLRGLPVLVILMIIFYVVFSSVNIDPVLVAVIAFGLNFAAYVSEMFRTGIEGVDKGQIEAGIALGFTKISTFIHIVLPQAIRRIMPVYKGELISLVKMTSIVGYIAVQDLTKAGDIIRSRTFDAFFPLIFVAILYLLISWILMSIIGYFEKISDPKMKSMKMRG
jgi:polar amino acid transport system substrate-binding protein